MSTLSSTVTVGPTTRTVGDNSHQASEDLQVNEPQFVTEPLRCSRILIAMVSLTIAAYFLTSGVMQITYAAFCISVCGVSFSPDDPNHLVTWLVASCWMTGLMRFLLSLCIGRPPYNRSVWPKPSEHVAFDEQMEALAFLPDLRTRSRDMNVLDRAQLAAGIIHPAFYHRTLLVSWQEGLIATMWLILHLIRVFQLQTRFNEQEYRNIWTLDQYLDELFASSGSNYTSGPLLSMVDYTKGTHLELANQLREPEIIKRLASHTCELMAYSGARVCYIEDVCQLILLLLALLVLPMFSRMFKFVSLR